MPLEQRQYSSGQHEPADRYEAEREPSAELPSSVQASAGQVSARPSVAELQPSAPPSHGQLPHEPDVPPHEHDEPLLEPAPPPGEPVPPRDEPAPEPGAPAPSAAHELYETTHAADPAQNPTSGATYSPDRKQPSKDYVPSSGGHRQPHELPPPDSAQSATAYDAANQHSHDEPHARSESQYSTVPSRHATESAAQTPTTNPPQTTKTTATNHHRRQTAEAHQSPAKYGTPCPY